MCGWVLNCVCVCFSTLIAATRSYSRSTGALHTPDTFGAAGEGWVHLFLCTSPTHSASVLVDAFSSLFSSHASLVDYSSENFCLFYLFFCSAMSRLLFFFLFLFVLTFCSRMSELSSGIACFRLFSCLLTTMLSTLLMPVFLYFFFELCPFSGGTSTPFLYFLLIILSPPVAPAMSPNESSRQLTCFWFSFEYLTVVDKGIGVRKIWERRPWVFSVSNVVFFPSFSPAVSLPLWTPAGSGFGISQSSRLSSSVSAMRVLNTGSDVEEALADALVWQPFPTAVHLKKKKRKNIYIHTHTQQAVTLCNSHLQECVSVRVCVC